MKPKTYSDLDSETPLSQWDNQSHGSTTFEKFKDSKEAFDVLQNPTFQELYERFNQLLEEEEERTDEAAPDLEPEDDHGNIEYKLMLCDLTMYKVKMRTTQMAFRLTVSFNNDLWSLRLTSFQV